MAAAPGLRLAAPDRVIDVGAGGTLATVAGSDRAAQGCARAGVRHAVALTAHRLVRPSAGSLLWTTTHQEGARGWGVGAGGWERAQRLGKRRCGRGKLCLTIYVKAWRSSSLASTLASTLRRLGITLRTSTIVSGRRSPPLASCPSL